SLQPIAEIVAGPHMPFAIFLKKQIIVRKQRRGLRTDVGKDEAADFLRFVCRMLNPILECASFGFRRLLQTLATEIIKPPVVTASNTGIFDAAKFQRCAAMRTMKSQDTEPPHAITEQHEIFAEQPDFNGCPPNSNVLGKTNRPPVAPQHLTGWCPSADPGQQF